MGSPFASPIYTPSMVSIRPQYDFCQSLPGTPMGMEHRNLGSIDVAAAMSHARMGLGTPDYFSGAPRFGGLMKPSSPYTNNYEIENNYQNGASLGSDSNAENLAVMINRSVILCTTPFDLNEQITTTSTKKRRTYMIFMIRTNLAATLANAQISASARYGKVFPHLCEDGRYPPDFSTPKTLITMNSLDSKAASPISIAKPFLPDPLLP